MDVFGDVQLNIYRKPEEYLESNPGDTDRLVEVAQSAFTRDGIPTREDVVDHVLPVSTLVTAEVEGDLAGFSSTDVRGLESGDTVYAVGLAVDEEYQSEGLGSLMRTLGVLEESRGMTQVNVSTRTQNPAVLSYMIDLFDAYPLPGEEMPSGIAGSLEDLARELDPDAEFDNPVMREVYPGSMYDEIPGHELKGFADELLGGDHRYEEGDAILVAGEVPRSEIKDAFEYAENQVDAEILYRRH